MFLLQLLIKLGGLFRSLRGEAAVRPALCGVQRTRRNAAFREALEQEINQLSVVFEYQFGPGPPHKIYRGIHSCQVEIEIRGRFRRIPALGTAGWCRIDKIQLKEIIFSALRRPITRTWTHRVQVFALRPKESRAIGTKEPFISSTHEKIDAKLVDIHRHRPTRLAYIEHK